MFSAHRCVAFILVASLALVAGCSGDKDKIVGKWKLVSMTKKDGKEEKVDFMGMSAVMEFTADGTVKVGLDISGMPAELKAKMDSNKMNETKQIGKYKVSGSTIEFTDTEKSGDSPLGKNNKGTLKFDGDTMTMSGDDGTVKFTRVK